MREECTGLPFLAMQGGGKGSKGAGPFAGMDPKLAAEAEKMWKQLDDMSTSDPAVQIPRPQMNLLAPRFAVSRCSSADRVCVGVSCRPTKNSFPSRCRWAQRRGCSLQQQICRRQVCSSASLGRARSVAWILRMHGHGCVLLRDQESDCWARPLALLLQGDECACTAW